jgi:hypothetical protein
MIYQKKAESPPLSQGNPAIFIRPVAFRLLIPQGLALSCIFF